jgi:hypothetical protein
VELNSLLFLLLHTNISLSLTLQFMVRKVVSDAVQYFSFVS